MNNFGVFSYLVLHQGLSFIRIFICFRFETSEELKAHRVEFHIDKIYTCPKCDKVMFKSS